MIPRMILVSVLLISFSQVIQLYGLRHITAGLAAVLSSALTPIALLGFSAGLGQERFTWRQAAAIAVGVVGILVLFGPKAFTGDLQTAEAAGAAMVVVTGLSGAGKSTVANLVDRKLHALGRHTFILDGDNVRHGLNRDLGFTEADRVENIRRAAEAARLMVDAGLIVLVSFISPYRSDRDAARERFDAGEFLEVYVDTPIDECRRRDPKGLYRRADQGLIRNFTGVDAPYEAPDSPEIHLRTEEAAAEDLAELVVEDLRRRAIIA